MRTLLLFIAVAGSSWCANAQNYHCFIQKPPVRDHIEAVSDQKSPGWMQIDRFSDEFNQDSLNIDRNKWKVSNMYCHGMSDSAYFKDALRNVQVDSGLLRIKAWKDDSIECLNAYLKYSSGFIQSKGLIQYGYLEMKCRLPREVHLQPCFWLWGRDYWSGTNQYDEIDVFEYIPTEPDNRIFRQTVIRNPTISFETMTLECKVLEFDEPFVQRDLIFAVEWLPMEVNFYLNGKWTNGFKYTTNENWISPYDHPSRSVFTCVDVENAAPQELQISLSLVNNPFPVDLSEGFDIDWIRSYKLQQGFNFEYWPMSINTQDQDLYKVHKSVRIGGAGHDGAIPENSNVTIWAEDYILLDQGFTLLPGSTFSARAITANPNLFSNNLAGPTGNKE